jgi:hypothetical protein
VLAALLAGCGTTQQNIATQQLLESDAIDAAISQIDFTPLGGHKVFFDATYIQDYKTAGIVNPSYVISSLRQQILSSGCLLQETRDTAEYIIEGRMGTLGSDQHDVVYGLPKNNALNVVASAVSAAPNLPSVPELALAKKVDSKGAAKIAVFAYHRETREPVWQSGLSIARSTSRNTWLMGAGPFQNGTIHRDDVEFAGSRYLFRPWKRREEVQRSESFASFERPAVFHIPHPPEPSTGESLHAGLEAPALLAESPEAKPIESAAPAEPQIQQASAEVIVDDPPPAATPAPTSDAAETPAEPGEPLPFPQAASSTPP